MRRRADRRSSSRRGSAARLRAIAAEPTCWSGRADPGPWSVQQLGGEHRGLGASFETELGEDARHVVLHRLLGEEQLLADLAVGQALGDQLEDATLLRG